MKPEYAMVMTTFVAGAVCGGYNYIKGERQLSPVDTIIISASMSTIVGIISKHLRESD